MINRLRWKFVGIIMAVVLAMLLAVSSLFITFTRDSLERDSSSVLARVITETETPSWELFRERSQVALPYFTVVVQPTGGAVLTSSQFYQVEDTSQMVDAINAALEKGTATGLLEDYQLRYLMEPDADGWRMAFVDVSYEQSTLRQAAQISAAVTIGAGILFFFIALLLSKWAVRPVEQAWQQQRRFVADASHELKTPLTIILSNADLLAQQGESSSTDRLRWTENIRIGGRQMSGLVEQMLLLAGSDRGADLKNEHKPTDLTELCRTAAMMFEPVAFESGRLLDWSQLEEALSVRGDQEKLKRLLDILLDNAVKYSVPGGGIRMTLERQGKRARLTVSDQGEPIPKEQLEQIFHRFYRRDESRSAQGFGLGLAIAETIVKEHGGRIWAESDPAGWNHFVCLLPLCPIAERGQI